VSNTDQVAAAAPRRAFGWLSFAATLLIIAGIFKILDAIWAFKYDDDITEDLQTIFLDSDPAAWGWIWLVTGVLLIVAGFGVLRGSQAARWFGIAAASLSAVVGYMWIFFRPLWAIVAVSLSMVVVFSLGEFGGRHRDE
jgi:hypothetical protein